MFVLNSSAKLNYDLRYESRVCYRFNIVLTLLQESIGLFVWLWRIMCKDNKNPLLMKKNCRFCLVFAKKEVIFYHEFILMSVPNLQYLQASAMRRTLAFPNGRRAKPSKQRSRITEEQYAYQQCSDSTNPVQMMYAVLTGIAL